MSEESGGGILASGRRRAGATEHSADGVVGRNTAVGAHWGATAVPRRRVAPQCAPTGSGWFARRLARSEGHTSELQSLMRTSYAVFCLQTQTPYKPQTKITQ